jgi:hypothetical protein
MMKLRKQGEDTCSRSRRPTPHPQRQLKSVFYVVSFEPGLLASAFSGFPATSEVPSPDGMGDSNARGRHSRSKSHFQDNARLLQYSLIKPAHLRLLRRNISSSLAVPSLASSLINTLQSLSDKSYAVP